MKGKPDYATAPITDADLSALMNLIVSRTGIYVTCDSYGGAIANTASDALAFAHRGGRRVYIDATCASSTSPLPPYVAEAAYVNYRFRLAGPRERLFFATFGTCI
jgi:hypothetical protein